MISGKEEISNCEIQISDCSCSKDFDQNFKNFVCEFSLCVNGTLAKVKEERRDQTAIKALQLCLKISCFGRTCHSFCRRPHQIVHRWNFCKFMQGLWSTGKKNLLSASHPHLDGTDFLQRFLRMSPKLASA